MKKTKQNKTVEKYKKNSKKKLDDIALVLRKATEGKFNKKELKLSEKNQEYNKLLEAINLAVRELKDVNKVNRKTREEEDLFYDFFKNMRSGAAIYEVVGGGKDFVFKDINKNGGMTTSVIREDVIGKSVVEVFPGIIDMGLLKILRKVQKTGKPTFLPSSLYKDKKIEKWFENFVFKLPTGEVVAIYDDRTEEIEDSRKTKESKKKYKNIFELSPEAIIIFDKKGTLLDLNGRVYDWLGYKRDEVIGTNILKLPYLTSKSKFIIAKKFTQRILGKEVPPYELEFVHKNGKKVIGLINATPIRDEKDNIIQDLVMITDVTEKRKADEAIRTLATIVETSNIIIISKDLDGNIISWNKGAEKVYGYKAEEVVGKNISLIIPKDKRDEIKKVIEDVRKDKKVDTIETERVTKGKKQIDVSLTISPVKDEAGNLTGFSSIGRDITNLKEIERTLEESERKYGKLFDAMDSGFVYFKAVYDEDGRIVDSIFIDMNSAYEKFTGLKRKEVVGKSAVKLLSSVTQSWFERFEEVLKEDKKINFTLYHKQTKKYYNVNSFKFDVDSYAVIFHDITEIKIAEKNEKESEERFFDIALSSADFIWEVDKNFKYVFTSGRVKEMFGYEPYEIMGKSIFDMIIKEDKSKIKKKIKRLSLKKEPIVNMESWNIKKEGGNVCLLINGIPILGENGEFKGYRGVNKDITNRKKMEKVVEQRNTILSMLSNASRKFLQTGISDESVDYFISALGKSTKVSRVYIFQKNEESDKSKILVSQKKEWVAFGVEPQIDNRNLQNMNMNRTGFKRWHEKFIKDEIITSNVSDLPKSEQKLLKNQSIKSILIIPVYVNKEWWGFVGFDDCEEERVWNEIEIEALKIAINVYGAAIERNQTERESSEQVEELQKMNSLMINRELKMIGLKEQIRNLEKKLKKNN